MESIFRKNFFLTLLICLSGLINHVKKWLGAAEPSSPLSLEIHGRKGKLGEWNALAWKSRPTSIKL